jgi:hypothetical protein
MTGDGMKRLFVGGPLDGQRLAALENQPVFMPVATPIDQICTRPPEVEIEMRKIVYTRRFILGQEVWAPQQMRNEQVIELLVARYGST